MKKKNETYNFPAISASLYAPQIPADEATKQLPIWLQEYNMKSYKDFRDALGFRESGGKYDSVNTFGFMGKYQFGKPRLYDLGYSIDGWHPKNRPQKTYLTVKEFLGSAPMQEMVFLKHIGQLKRIIIKRYSKYIGKKILNIEVTLSGLVAGAHLKGLGGVKQFLRGINNRDGYGTEIVEYVSKFGGYHLDEVPEREPRKNNLFIAMSDIPQPRGFNI